MERRIVQDGRIQRLARFIWEVWLRAIRFRFFGGCAERYLGSRRLSTLIRLVITNGDGSARQEVQNRVPGLRGCLD